MDLSNLKPAKGSINKNSKRVGRGQGSGKGGTATRGVTYGGAGGGTYYGNNQGGWGGNGAVRVIWGNDSTPRQFPSTNTSQGTSITVQQV